MSTTSVERGGSSKARVGFETDEGWAWVVLVAAFFCNVCFDGIIFSFGIIFIELLDAFGESKSDTAWIGSVISGTYGIVGESS